MSIEGKFDIIFIPEIDTAVIVMFKSGDPTYAPAIIAPATIAPLKATIAPR